MSEMEGSQPNFSERFSILMVDDQAIYGEVLKRMIVDTSWEFNFCQNPLEAIDMAKRVKPTVILQDLVMPEMDGLELVKAFRSEKSLSEVPLIVLSSTEDASIKYKAFANGANDYMVKLPEKLELLARIEYHCKAYLNYCQKNRAMLLLKESQDALKKELSEAQNYVESLLPAKFDGESLDCDWVYKSSTMLGGDCFGYSFIDDRNFAIYLLDVCGHGVGAALLSVSAVNVLRSQTLSGIDFREPANVLEALSQAFDMDTQNGMFFTLWYGVYNIKTRSLKYSTGGHPPAVLVSKNSLSYLGTDGTVIGANMGIKYIQKEVLVGPNSNLYVFSDGVYEVEMESEHRMMQVEDFAKLLGQNEKPLNIMKAVQKIQNRENFDDDFSLCKIEIK